MTYDEEQIGRLLSLFPAAPEAWVLAAQELPAARAALDELVARAERDAAFRQELVADLERALAANGYEGSPSVVSRLHRLLESVESTELG
jgi:hypothetical protein